MNYKELLERAYAQCPEVSSQHTGRTSPEEAALRAHLVRCYAAQAIELRAFPAPFVTRISEQPRVSPLVRLQAEIGRVVTNRKHESVSLDVVGRQIVRCFDGKHGRPEIEQFIWQRVEQGELNIQNEEGETVDYSQAQPLISGICVRTLEQLRDLALLIG